MGSELAKAVLFSVTLTLVCCAAMVKFSGRSAFPFRSTCMTRSSKASLETRTEYFPGARFGAENLPDSSERRTSGCLKSPPEISMRALATTAPEGSFTVPDIVSARSRVANARQRIARNDAYRNLSQRACRGVLMLRNELRLRSLGCGLSGWRMAPLGKLDTTVHAAVAPLPDLLFRS